MLRSETPTLLETFGRLELYSANEAETRLKLIDDVVFRILGWKKEDVLVEEGVREDDRSGYIDYLLTTASTTVVIEAKRVGEALFDFPEKRTLKLGSLKSKKAYKFVRQARNYARRKGVQFAVVTNGNQWLVFPAQRTDGVEFEKSNAIFFPNLDSALDQDFIEFNSLLSRRGVIDGELSQLLLGRVKDQFKERRLRHFFSNVGRVAPENPLFQYLDSDVQIAFSNEAIEGNPELIAKCYVKDGDRAKFDRQINMHLKRIEPPADTKVRRPLQKSTQSNSGVDALEKFKHSKRPLALLVLGQVGAGKTTFLNYTRHVSAKSHFEKSPDGVFKSHWIYLDFRDFEPAEPVVEFIYSKIKDYFIDDDFFSDYEKCVRPAHKSEIDHKCKTIWKPISNSADELNRRIVSFLEEAWESNRYVDTLLSYASSKCSIVLVIDNVDQIEKSSIQAEIFSNSVGLASRTSANLITVLRDATYVQHKSTALFDAFDMDTIYIDPPPIEMVLSRRFKLLEHRLEGKSATFQSETGVKVKVESLGDLVSLIRESVLGTRIGSIINALAAGDIRLGLRMTRQFLESGYSNPGRAIHNIKHKKKYIMPRHEALRAILLGRQSVYEESTSLIGNPFDASLGVSRLQQLRLFLLFGLVQRSSQADFTSVAGSDLHALFATLGVDDTSSLQVLRDLVAFRYLRTIGHDAASFDSAYYPTRLAGYVCRNLLPDFTFLEAMMMDTFIGKTTHWSLLKDVSEKIDQERNVSKRVKLRAQRARRFYDFVQDGYAVLEDQATSHRLAGEWCGNPLKESRSLLESNLSRAITSASRNYGTK